MTESHTIVLSAQSQLDAYGDSMLEGQPNIPSQFILYAAAFRLAVVSVGIACIVFGYRLLTRATGRTKRADGALVASAGTTHLELRNLAPGTMFAAFGMVIVSVMLYQGMPEFRQQSGDKGIVVRSGPPGLAQTTTLAMLTERARALEQSGDVAGATEAYESAVDQVATPVNNLAAVYLQQNRDAEALALARIAADLRPFRADIVDTLASAYSRSGDRDAALKAAERAARLDAKYREHLEALQRGERR